MTDNSAGIAVGAADSFRLAGAVDSNRLAVLVAALLGDGVNVTARSV